MDKKYHFGNVRDVEWQNNVISEYLTDTHGLSDINVRCSSSYK